MKKKSAILAVASAVVFTVAAAESVCLQKGGVTKAEYLDLMEAAVASYSDDHIRQYIDKCAREGVTEHGFPRLAANLACLVSNGRMPGKRDFLERMMSISCSCAPKGRMKFEGNEFSVKELAAAICELERAKVFDKSVTEAWRADIRAVDAAKCYKVQLRTDGKRVNNWLVFGCASEQARIALGMGGDAARVEKCVADQLRWFDPNGMYRDPNQPAVYDIVTRLQFMLTLHYGYDGPSRAKLEELLDRSAEPTLAMLSAAGEIPYGGRSNQFLHNHTFYAAVCEWYAARYKARGDVQKAARFRRAARATVDALKEWLAVRPMRHVKNFYPRGSGERGSGMGCEGYAYFDKYMVTMGSWAMLGYLFADETIPAAAEPAGGSAPSSFVTTPDFHWVLLKAGDYSAQFDYNADLHYDCDGLGRIQRKGAPSTICLSVPCALKPGYRTEVPNQSSLAVVPAVDAPLVLAGSGSNGDAAWADWTIGGLLWKCRLASDGLAMMLSGPGNVAMKLPAFEFDGEQATEIACDGKSLSVSYHGWTCTYTTDGEIVDCGKICCNRNGRYRTFEARGKERLSVKVVIEVKK